MKRKMPHFLLHTRKCFRIYKCRKKVKVRNSRKGGYAIWDRAPIRVENTPPQGKCHVFYHVHVSASESITCKKEGKMGYSPTAHIADNPHSMYYVQKTWGRGRLWVGMGIVFAT